MSLSSSSSTLPTPRQLLTSLLIAISRIPPPPASDRQPITDALGGTSRTTHSTNPLKHVSPAHRPLFTTLHVLFPSLLLPALDLLDRGLVTRLQLLARKEHIHDEDDGDTEMMDAASTTAPSVYVVRSAQKKPAGRRAGGGSESGEPASASRRYIVHTAPWNCTCAAFAFAAFPPQFSATLSRDETSNNSREQGNGDEWQFGGMSFDGMTGGADDMTEGASVPPCCKHLLACVLAERWAVGLSGYVNERVVSREEMAGMFADV